MSTAAAVAAMDPWKNAWIVAAAAVVVDHHSNNS